ncbi:MULTISPECIES: CHAP domain-containing protein [Streptomyces]|uniref:CHAP domain-containing protein n=1 Tax=Streptomyces TaxID=1883 RepID=UPI0008FC9E2C|nr:MULTISPECIES: CHAP domain-containing protein [Streptomyces]MCH0558014.1 CHAP domain-containing protein [Streptomyces sp. MUM 16J]
MLGLAPQAWAETGGYPYADYNGPGASAPDSWWTDASGNGWSPYGYAFRNCTDYVAWKMQSLGVPDSLTRGLGDGGSWYDNAASKTGLNRGTSPKVGAAAVSTSGSRGHVAYVEAVNDDGSIVTTEYNWPTSGGSYDGAFHQRSGKPSDMGFTEFVYFGEHMTNPPDNSGGSTSDSTSNYIIAVKKRSFGTTQQVWTATKSGVYLDQWWPGSGGISHTKVYTAGAGQEVVHFDKITQPDGNTQNLYIATQDTAGGTTGGIYEVWWDGHGFSAPAQIIKRNDVLKVVADLKVSGSTLTHRLYVLAQDGPYEYWWRDGTGVSNGYLLWNITNGLDIVKSVAPNGADEVYVAVKDHVYRMRWPVNGGVQKTQVTALADTVGVDAQTIGNTVLVYTVTKTGVHETWQKYYPDTSSWSGLSNPAKIVTVPSGEMVIAGIKRMDGTTHQVYVATEHNVYQYWWNSTSGGVQRSSALISMASSDFITGIDESVDPTDSAIEQLYTVHASFVNETWWGDGSLHNGNAIVAMSPDE